jgi:hypothetical protein
MGQHTAAATEEQRNRLLVAYDAINRHWVHAEDERWSILSNFLLASTILLLAWAAVFAAPGSPARRLILSLVALVGLAITVLWLTIASRVSVFIDLYTRLGEDVEQALEISKGPFSEARDRIREKHDAPSRLTDWMNRTIDWLGLRLPSRVFVVIVPAAFGLLYIALLVVSWFTVP